MDFSITIHNGDYNQKSYKMYRENGGLLKFGPNWDYDSCSYGLPFIGTYVFNSFEVGSKSFNSAYISDSWGYTLYNDIDNGRSLFKAVWDGISINVVMSFINNQKTEINAISSSAMFNCEMWMNNQYFSVFDNLNYYWQWISNQLMF